MTFRGFTSELSNQSITTMVLDIGFWFSQIYPTVAVIFYMCLTWSASMMLQHLIDQLPNSEIPLRLELNQQLLKWKRNFGIIGDYIAKINNFFGVTLLAFLTRQLFNFIFYIYWLMDELQEPIDSYTRNLLIIYITRIVIYVALLALISHRIKQKVGT